MGIKIHLIAGGDGIGKAQASLRSCAHEELQCAARLKNDANRALRHAGNFRIGISKDTIGIRQIAHAIGSGNADIGAFDKITHPLTARERGWIFAIANSACINGGRLEAARSRIFQHIRHSCGGDDDDGMINGLRQIAQRGIGLFPIDLALARIDQIDRTWIFMLTQSRVNIARPAAAFRRPDNGQRFGTQYSFNTSEQHLCFLTFGRRLSPLCHQHGPIRQWPEAKGAKKFINILLIN